MRADLRLLQIVHVLALYHLDDLIKPLPHSWLPRLLFKFLPSYWLFYLKGLGKYRAEERSRLALVALGPIFIKLGQLLATRRDLLDDDLANELETLTENVPPFSAEGAQAIIESELSGSISELFKSFDKEPMASASIAQVHAARLHSGEEVVLKVLRPGIEKTVKRDIALMAWIATTIEAWIPDSRLFHLQALVENYHHVIMGEINLHREAANTIKMRKNALRHNYLYIPRVHLELSSRRVMCSERIYGIPVNQADKIQAQGTDLKKLAENGVKIFFGQVFRDNFFHADMHPGNIFVNTAQPDANQYVSVDCAIAGSLSREDQVFLAQQLLALIQKNYSRNAQLFIDAGWVTQDIHKEELALRLQKIVEPIFDQAMSEIEFAPILFELLTMAREFRIKVNPNFLLFQKTLIHIEGLGKQLYPELNVWEVGRPLIEEWIRSLLSPSKLFEAISESAPQLMQQLPELPSLILSSLDRNRGVAAREEAGLVAEMQKLQAEQRSSRRLSLLAFSFVGAAGFMASGLSVASIGAEPLTLVGLGFGILVYQSIKK